LMGIDIVAKYQFHWDHLTTFRHHVRIVKPYIDVTQEELLISKWSQMQNQKNYDEIQLELKAIAKENGVDLPARKI